MEDAPLLPSSGSNDRHRKSSFSQFLRAFFPLCFISFGGPQAHVALFHKKFVDVPSDYTGPQVKESTFLELYSVAQALPGPGSTQLATSLGATFGGLIGAFGTFFVWHLPGFIIMTAAGAWFHRHLNDSDSLVLINNLLDFAVGLVAAAFSFVIIAAYKIVSRTCVPCTMKMAIATVSMFIAVVVPPSTSSWVFILLLIGGGVVYVAYDFLSLPEEQPITDVDEEWEAHVSPVAGSILIAFVFITTIVIAFLPDSDKGTRILKIFWRIGLLVFGGGIVVVPMLINEIVKSDLLPSSVFLAGFGLFGCVPGPMFSIATFLGAAIVPYQGALYGSFGLFGPGVLLQLGILPFWERFRTVKIVQTVLNGVNAAAVGLIIAGVWSLVQSALAGPTAFALTFSATILSAVFETSPVGVIMSHGILGALLVYLEIGGPYHVIKNV